MVTRTELIEVFSIIALMIVVSITLLTNFRTCEVLENNQVKKLPCYEVIQYEK